MLFLFIKKLRAKVLINRAKNSKVNYNRTLIWFLEVAEPLS
jgi:hypothetical protein